MLQFWNIVCPIYLSSFFDIVAQQMKIEEDGFCHLLFLQQKVKYALYFYFGVV